MDTRLKAVELSEETSKILLRMGTEIDEIYRKFRELRLLEDDLAFQSALLKVEHAFFMVVQSLNILREHLHLIGVSAKKGEAY
ncbi:MAG: hypothetical protein N3C13_05810 [Aquificaceae bacterium]|nr:hypothetical protein [Aquificaceae bacterium]MCX8060697.1 hypothetical protein [Aquificaceae bacterium]MDW8096614.1 hypothetical protein [Aquificaceae bacterium]